MPAADPGGRELGRHTNGSGSAARRDAAGWRRRPPRPHWPRACRWECHAHHDWFPRSTPHRKTRSPDRRGNAGSAFPWPLSRPGAAPYAFLHRKESPRTAESPSLLVSVPWPAARRPWAPDGPGRLAPSPLLLPARWGGNKSSPRPSRPWQSPGRCPGPPGKPPPHRRTRSYAAAGHHAGSPPGLPALRSWENRSVPVRSPERERSWPAMDRGPPTCRSRPTHRPIFSKILLSWPPPGCPYKKHHPLWWSSDSLVYPNIR